MLTNANPYYLRACACRVALGHYWGCANRVGGSFRWDACISPRIDVFYSWVAGRGTPHFWRITNKFLHEKVAKLASIRVREFSVFLAIFRNAQYQIMRIALYPTVFWRTDASGDLASYTNRFFIDFLCFWAWGSSGEPLG